VAPGGKTNWCDFARLVIREAITWGDTFKLAPDMVLSIKTKDYPIVAKRPMNSRLATSLFERTFSITLPPWEEGVFAIMKSLYKG
jgi:dTDP-4-dehydrorhamnose reductase